MQDWLVDMWSSTTLRLQPLVLCTKSISILCCVQGSDLLCISQVTLALCNCMGDSSLLCYEQPALAWFSTQGALSLCSGQLALASCGYAHVTLAACVVYNRFWLRVLHSGLWPLVEHWQFQPLVLSTRGSSLLCYAQWGVISTAY